MIERIEKIRLKVAEKIKTSVTNNQTMCSFTEELSLEATLLLKRKSVVPFNASRSRQPRRSRHFKRVSSCIKPDISILYG